MSFFYSTADVKLNKNVHLTVFKPSSKSQTILVKGKLGQFKLEWNLQSFLEKIQTENQQWFDGIIDVTIFDGVEGLDYCVYLICECLKIQYLSFSVIFSSTR